MKILITGARGMLGKHLMEEFPDAIPSTCDLREFNEFSREVYHHRPDVVIHAASAVGGISYNLDNPLKLLNDNLLIHANVVNACVNYKVPKLLAISSACVYQPSKDLEDVKSEEDGQTGVPEGSNYGYAVSKRALQTMVDICRNSLGLKYSYLIPTNMYSEYDRFDVNSGHFIGSLIVKIKNAIENGTVVRLLGSGKSIRQFLYAGDLAKKIKEMLENNIVDNINILSSSSTYSIKDVAEIVCNLMDFPMIRIEFANDGKDGQMYRVLDDSRLTKYIKDYNLEELKPLTVGLKTTLKNKKN